jgi:hypothetical protein
MENNLEITWYAPEYEHREKDNAWYWKTIIVATILIGLAVWQRNIMFVIFLLLAEIMIIVFGNRQPELIKFDIAEKGVRIKDKWFHPYTHLESFSVIINEHSRWDDVILHSKNHIHSTIRVKVPKDLLAKVHYSLSLVLEETVYEETLVEAIEHYVGF